MVFFVFVILVFKKVFIIVINVLYVWKWILEDKLFYWLIFFDFFLLGGMLIFGKRDGFELYCLLYVLVW